MMSYSNNTIFSIPTGRCYFMLSYNWTRYLEIFLSHHRSIPHYQVDRGCHLTRSPIEVRLMLSSWFCRPKLPATSTTIWRQVQGIVGRKSVTTNCRHWKAVRINISLKKKIKNIRGVLRHLHTVAVKLKTVDDSCLCLSGQDALPPN